MSVFLNSFDYQQDFGKNFKFIGSFKKEDPSIAKTTATSPLSREIKEKYINIGKFAFLLTPLIRGSALGAGGILLRMEKLKIKEFAKVQYQVT
jgi:hypothetical protein